MFLNFPFVCQNIFAKLKTEISRTHKFGQICQLLLPIRNQVIILKIVKAALFGRILKDPGNKILDCHMILLFLKYLLPPLTESCARGGDGFSFKDFLLLLPLVVLPVFLL